MINYKPSPESRQHCSCSCSCNICEQSWGHRFYACMLQLAI